MTFISPAGSPSGPALLGLKCNHAQPKIGQRTAGSAPQAVYLDADAVPTQTLDSALPGGVLRVFDQPPAETPAPVRQNQQLGTAEGYRAAAIADGIPLRPHGLFAAGDVLLHRLAARPDLHAFEKHLPGADSPYEMLPAGGWVTGDAAAARGIDLRLFYRRPAHGEQYGSLVAAVRFGNGASIGLGFFLSAHGGAIETCLDEATAELGKMEFIPFLSTVEATFRIRRPVPLHTTLLLECSVKQKRGIRCWVEGRLQSADGETLLASCEAQLVDMTHFI